MKRIKFTPLPYPRYAFSFGIMVWEHCITVLLVSIMNNAEVKKNREVIVITGVKGASLFGPLAQGHEIEMR